MFKVYLINVFFSLTGKWFLELKDLFKAKENNLTPKKTENLNPTHDPELGLIWRLEMFKSVYFGIICLTSQMEM